MEIHHQAPGVAMQFRQRATASMIGITGFGAIGLGLIIMSAVFIGGIPLGLGLFIVGVACCLASLIMVIGWGAADGHGTIYTDATRGHERLYELLAKFCAEHFGAILLVEQQQAESVQSALDELRDRRGRRGGA